MVTALLGAVALDTRLAGKGRAVDEYHARWDEGDGDLA